MMNDKNSLFDYLIEQADAPFSGWDFSFLADTSRMASEPVPWSYGSEVLKYIMNSSSLLDMGTGGGELLTKLRPLPKMTSATESYPPNVPIARKRLEPLGVNVVQIDNDEELPFKDQSFDLVINRHEAFHAPEVRRILKPGGVFITQQVGGKDLLDLNSYLNDSKIDYEYGHWVMNEAKRQLLDAGFTIQKNEEAFPKTTFFDVGAILYYIRSIPWQYSNKTLTEWRPALYNVHRTIEDEQCLTVTSHRFFIVSTKPNN